MKLPMTVTYEGGTKKLVVAQFADFIAFENVHNKSVAKMDTELRLSDLAWIAWHTEKRNKQTALGFDDWNVTVEELELGGEDARIVPLEKSQPTG